VKTDAQGVFTIDSDMQPGAPYLIQAMHQGITYNRMLQPGSPASGIALEVYDASANVPEAKVAQHMILLEPSGTELVVNQSIVFNNTGKTTYQDPEGTLKVLVPEDVATPVQVRIMAPQGMPISRQAEKGSAPNTYVVKYPIKPGETRIDVMYAMPAGSPSKFSGKILHSGGPVRFVAPPGVTLEGPSLTGIGNEPQTGAAVYELKGTEYAMTIQGTGALQPAPAAASGGQAEAGASGEEQGGGIDVAKPRIYQRAGWILGLTFLMLAIGFLMLYRTEAGSKPGDRA
jgi:hypothetical protein